MRTVSIYANLLGGYNSLGSNIFEIENGDVFVWNNCIIQVEDIWGNSGDYDSEMASSHGGSIVSCSVMSTIHSSTQFFHRDSGLYQGKRINFPADFVAISVNRRYIPPPPEPPPPPPAGDKFQILSGNQPS